MVSYNRKYTPQVNDRSNQCKGNGEICGRVPGESPFKPNDHGISYKHGMGCSRHDNCFTCTLPDCKFGGGTNINDRVFMANRGDGLTIWWSC